VGKAFNEMTGNRYFDKKSEAHGELRWTPMVLPVIGSRISAMDDLLHPDTPKAV
jgi:hypothetical protein